MNDMSGKAGGRELHKYEMQIHENLQEIAWEI